MEYTGRAEQAGLPGASPNHVAQEAAYSDAGRGLGRLLFVQLLTSNEGYLDISHVGGRVLEGETG